MFTKKNPPYSVELDLGNIPRPRTLTAKAFDAAGTELAMDELIINSAANRFQVRLAEPQKGKRYQGSLLARAETTVPDGQTVERVEFFLNETRVATLYQPPFQQPIVLPKSEEIAYVRAVAYLSGRQLDREPGLRQRARGPGRGQHQLRRAVHHGVRPPEPAHRGPGGRRTSP